MSSILKVVLLTTITASTFGHWAASMKCWRESTRARDLDPLSAYIASNLGYQYRVAGRYDEAIRETRRALDLDPNLAWAQAQMGWIYTVRQLYPQAIAECQKLPESTFAVKSENQFVALTVALPVYALAG